MVDYGDSPTIPGYHVETLGKIEEFLTPVHRAGVVPLCLGGDHSIGYPDVRGLAPYIDGNIGIIHFDRHSDINAIVSTFQVEALEVFKGAAEVPPEYAAGRGGTCGVILIWILLMTLFLPDVNYSKSYATVAGQVAAAAQAIRDGDDREGFAPGTPWSEVPDDWFCPDCGVPLQHRGAHARTLQTHGGLDITLERHYGVCPACGAGLFPPR